MDAEPIDLQNEKLRTVLSSAYRIAESEEDISNLIAYVTFVMSELPEFKSKHRKDSQSQIQLSKTLQCSQATISRRIKYVEKRRLGK